MNNKNKKPVKFPYALIVAAVLLTADFVIGYLIVQTFISQVPANSISGIQCPPACGATLLTLDDFLFVFIIIDFIVIILLVLYGPRVPGTKSDNTDAEAGRGVHHVIKGIRKR